MVFLFDIYSYPIIITLFNLHHQAFTKLPKAQNKKNVVE